MLADDRQRGRALRHLREDAKLMAKDLAERSGVSRSQISEAENGRRPITMGMLARLAPSLGMTADQMDRRISYLAGAYEEAGEGTSLNEPMVSYDSPQDPQQPPRTSKPADAADLEALASYFTTRLSRPELFELIREFTNQAEQGDLVAVGRARALLTLATQKK